jgi:hypothetical protein
MSYFQDISLNKDFMSASGMFQLANGFAFLGWVLLIGFPNKSWTLLTVRLGFIGLLSMVYVFLLLPGLSAMNFQDFNSLDGVMNLFSKEDAVLLGWIHYLAFDLLAGTYIVEKAKAQNLPRWLYTFCLPFTFMFGPFGILLFFIISLIYQRKI